MKETTVYDCTLIHLAKNHTLKGNITAVNNGKEIPFSIKRVYYLYDIPGGSSRGGHAHRELEQLIVAASGSFDLIVSDGNIKRSFHLSQPYIGVCMPAGLWRELDNFSSGAICLVLASNFYDEADYIRDFNTFQELKQKSLSLNL